MATRDFNGPVVEAGDRNVVLRDALFHSPVARTSSSANYYTIRIGLREGEYTSWIGEWSESDRDVVGGEGVSALDRDRKDMRLRPGHAIVVRVESYGTPASIEGSRLNFKLSRVGGQHGSLAPLISGGATISEPATRDAVLVMERQVNQNLASWEESVQLKDPSGIASSGMFQGRLELDSSTQISLQRYAGNWVEVDGEDVSVGDDGLTLPVTDGLLAASGAVTSTAPSNSTLYYVYVGSVADLRLSATAPTANLGAYYLGTSGAATGWRFCGWAYVDGSGNFNDSDTAREVVNYYNRLKARLYTCPAYNDGNAWTSYTQSSTTWAKVNGGTGSDVSFIANGEDLVALCATMRAVLSTSGSAFGAAVGIDGVTDVETSGQVTTASGIRHRIVVPREYAPSSAGRHTASLLGRQSSGTATIYADSARYGATADPAETYLLGWVMA